MAQIGVLAKIHTSGTSTAFTDIATTKITNRQYIISDKAKRMFDSNASFSVSVDGVVADASTYTIEYLHGIVNFANDVAGVVIVSGKFMPLVSIGNIKSCTITEQADVLDTTTLGNGTHKGNSIGLKDTTMSISELVADSSKFSKYFHNNAKVIISIDVSTATAYTVIRGVFKVGSVSHSFNDAEIVKADAELFSENNKDEQMKWITL